MNSRRVQIVLAVVFFVVAVAAMYNTWELNQYVRNTLPRDLRQEQCIADSIAALKAWARARSDADDVYGARDEALLVIIDEKLSEPGIAPTPEQLGRYRSAVTSARQAREASADVRARNPLPNC